MQVLFRCEVPLCLPLLILKPTLLWVHILKKRIEQCAVKMVNFVVLTMYVFGCRWPCFGGEVLPWQLQVFAWRCGSFLVILLFLWCFSKHTRGLCTVQYMELYIIMQHCVKMKKFLMRLKRKLWALGWWFVCLSIKSVFIVHANLSFR